MQRTDNTIEQQCVDLWHSSDLMTPAEIGHKMALSSKTVINILGRAGIYKSGDGRARYLAKIESDFEYCVDKLNRDIIGLHRTWAVSPELREHHPRLRRARYTHAQRA